MEIKIIEGKRVRMLDKHFSKSKRTFHWVKDYAIGGKTYHLYKVTFNEGTELEYSHFELFKQKIIKKHNLDSNNDYTHIEYYPSDECFGFWAWSLMSVNHADDKASKLV